MPTQKCTELTVIIFRVEKTMFSNSAEVRDMGLESYMQLTAYWLQEVTGSPG